MQQEPKFELFIQQNSLDGGFLQSAQWLQFQTKVGRKMHVFAQENFVANVIEHTLPIVGKYFYCPRGPIASTKIEEFPISNPPAGRAGFQFSNKSQKISDEQLKRGMQSLLELAKKEKIGWIRIDPSNEQLLQKIKENISQKISKAPHDMQPKEIFVLDIAKTEEELLSQMKAKTRYNINLAKKKGVVISHGVTERYIEAFLNLTQDMAQRQGITAHPAEYYRQMIETLPPEMLQIYVAEFEGKIIAANLMLFFGTYATYLHGASGNEHRNVMAPFLLQWQAILDAKENGCLAYDFGGIKTKGGDNSWEGITNFKLGFSPATGPRTFPGSYDIVIDESKYAAYRGLQRLKAMITKFR